MTPTADELAKHLTALTERVAGLATQLAQTSQELQGSGTLPAKSLIAEPTSAREEFMQVRGGSAASSATRVTR